MYLQQYLNRHLVVENQLNALLLIYFMLFPYGRSSWIPLIIMSVLGLIGLPSIWRDLEGRKGVYWLLALAGCIYFPACISAYGSVDLSRTFKFLLIFPVMFWVGCYIYQRIFRGEKLDIFIYGLAVITLFWSITVVMQFLYPSGMFGNDLTHLQGIHTREAGGGLLLGVILGSLMPLMLGFFFEKKQYTAFFILAMMLTALIFASGTRSAWLVWLILMMMLPYLLWFQGIKLNKKTISKLIGLYALLIMTVVTIIISTGVMARLMQTLPFFKHPNIATFQNASSGRFIIWRDAINLGLKYPIHGSGVNTFRYAQHLVAEKDSGIEEQPKNHKHPKIGKLHTHQIILEVWSGAGGIGLIGIAIFYGILFCLSKRVLYERSWLLTGAMLGLWAGFLPFNTHNNFYGSWMAGWLWIWLGLMMGLLKTTTTKQVEGFSQY